MQVDKSTEEPAPAAPAAWVYDAPAASPYLRRPFKYPIQMPIINNDRLQCMML
jgi:hypothetical protein